MSAANVTTGVMSLSGSGSTALLTILIMAGIIITLYILFKYFGKIILGAIVSGVMIGIYALSSWIAKQAGEGNIAPTMWVVKAILFVAASLLIGYGISLTKWYKEWESLFSDDGKSNKKTKK